MRKAMDRGKVYQIIDGERSYQDQRWQSTEFPDQNHSIADWLVFIEHHVANAKVATYMLDRTEALEQVRKIAALAVACMEHNETEPRK